MAQPSNERGNLTDWVGVHVRMPTPMQDKADAEGIDALTPPELAMLQLERMVTARGGTVVSIDDSGHTMVDAGPYGEIGYPVEVLRRWHEPAQLLLVTEQDQSELFTRTWICRSNGDAVDELGYRQDYDRTGGRAGKNTYRIFRLVPVDPDELWQWGIRVTAAPIEGVEDRQVVVAYSSEQDARAAVPAGGVVVRRRGGRGNSVWQEAPACRETGENSNAQ